MNSDPNAAALNARCRERGHPGAIDGYACSRRGLRHALFHDTESIVIVLIVLIVLIVRTTRVKAIWAATLCPPTPPALATTRAVVPLHTL